MHPQRGARASPPSSDCGPSKHLLTQSPLTSPRQSTYCSRSPLLPPPRLQTAARQMAAAVSGDVTWGMTEDAVDTEDLSLVDWRAYQSAGNTLNDRMQKMAERIR